MIITVIDQILKSLIVKNILPANNISFLNGLINITYIKNKGAALGILQDRQIFFICLTVFMIVFFIYLYACKKLNSKLFVFSYIFMLGGAISNLIDRLLYGYVIDYIQLSFFPPVCNFADYCISVGAILMIIYIFKNPCNKKY